MVKKTKPEEPEEVEETVELDLDSQIAELLAMKKQIEAEDEKKEKIARIAKLKAELGMDAEPEEETDEEDEEQPDIIEPVEPEVYSDVVENVPKAKKSKIKGRKQKFDLPAPPQPVINSDSILMEIQHKVSKLKTPVTATLVMVMFTMLAMFLILVSSI